MIPSPESQGNTIIVWAWRDAPRELRAIYNSNGGDEDWVALVPANYKYRVGWVYGDEFGCYMSDGKLDDGRKVYFGVHE